MTDIQARLPDLNDLMQDLQLAKEIAIKNEQANQLVTAVMAQAKLLGLDNQTATPQPHLPPVFNIVGVSPDDTKTAKTADSSYNGRYVK